MVFQELFVTLPNKKQFRLTMAAFHMQSKRAVTIVLATLGHHSEKGNANS